MDVGANKTYDFVFDGLIAMSANVPLIATDRSGAIVRRMKVVYTTNSINPMRQRELLVSKGGKWHRELADELPAIFNWAISISLEGAATSILTFKSQGVVVSNPMQEWVEQCVMPIKGRYIGTKKDS